MQSSPDYSTDATSLTGIRIINIRLSTGVSINIVVKTWALLIAIHF